MLKGRVVAIVKVGKSGLRVVTPDGDELRYSPHTVARVPVGSTLEGKYKILKDRVEELLETK